MLQRRHALWAFASLASAAAVPGLVHAQGPWPNRPVRFVVGFAPGGPADIIARLLGVRLGEALGQPVVVENRPGAGGSVASGVVAKAEPDGYTLLVNTSSLAVNAGMGRNLGFDTERDLVLASLVASSPNLIVGAPQLPAKTLKGVMAAAASGKYNYGTAGAGTTPQLSAEYLFKVLGKVDVTHVPFQGAGPALNATMAGQVELASVALPSAVELVKAGRVVGLAVTSRKRVAAIPDVPTVAESGFSDFEDYTWVGVLAPSRTPAAIVQRLNAEIAAIQRSADFQAKLAQAGFEVMGGSTQDASTYFKSELVKWAKVIKETGATPN
ncbi:MAG TPA: tripartite tricarboxylate transporter substrate binding protein [Variovorax sp.]